MTMKPRCGKCGRPMDEFGKRSERRIQIGEMEARKYACSQPSCLDRKTGKKKVGDIVVVRATLEYIGWLMASYAQSVANGEAPEVTGREMRILWHFADELFDQMNADRGVIAIGQYLDDGTKVAA